MTGVVCFFSETYKMPQKKKVEGAVLDLTGIEGVAVDIDALVAAANVMNVAIVMADVKPKVKGVIRHDITDNEIREIVVSRIQECICGKKVHMCKKFGEQRMCYSCYIEKYNELSAKIEGYVKQIGMTECKICGIPRSGFVGFHFDHINMFNKDDTVGLMICRGADYQTIIEEINKCQILCISCHTMVTAMEAKLGFLKAKRRNMKSKEDYDTIMTRVYEIIRQEVRGGFGDGSG